MRLAIQQPYFFPYLGYFKLIEQVDVFVLLNDVQYARRGWINRNKIKDDQPIVVPVQKTHRNALINEIKIDNTQPWLSKMCKTIVAKYGKKAMHNDLFLKFSTLSPTEMLLPLLKTTLQDTCKTLNLKTQFIDSETIKIDPDLKRENKILAIAQSLGATEYFNLPGGKSLYNPERFRQNNIQLNFINNANIINYLSVLDWCINENSGNLLFKQR